MKLTYLFTPILLLFFTTSYCQSLYLDGEIEYNDGNKEKVKIKFTTPEHYQFGCTIKLADDTPKDLTTKDVKSFTIEGNEKYEKKRINFFDSQVDSLIEKGIFFLQCLEEGDLNLYRHTDGWMYVSKGEDAVIRLEKHMKRFSPETNSFQETDTLKVYEQPQRGLYLVNRGYFYQLAALVNDKKITPRPNLDYSRNEIRKEVKKYNNLAPNENPKSYFTNQFRLDIYGGANIYLGGGEIKPDQILEAGVELMNPSLSKSSSVYMRYTTFSDGLHFVVGLRKRFFIQSMIRPYIILELNNIGFGAGFESNFGDQMSLLVEFIKVDPVNLVNDGFNPLGLRVGANITLFK